MRGRKPTTKFGNRADEDLPLLTRCYQTDTSRPDDLHDLYFAWARTAEGVFRGFSPEMAQYKWPMETFAPVVKAVEFARRVMEDLFLDGVMTAADVWSLYKNGGVPISTALFERALQNTEEDPIVDFRALALSYSFEDRRRWRASPINALARQIYEDLYAAAVSALTNNAALLGESIGDTDVGAKWVGEDGRVNMADVPFVSPFARCEECQSIFLPRQMPGRKTPQRFCSQRCSHRNGQRKRQATAAGEAVLPETPKIELRH